MIINDALHYAYAKGYWDGRANGEGFYPTENEDEKILYGLGYERGVGDYCREIDSEVTDE